MLLAIFLYGHPMDENDDDAPLEGFVDIPITLSREEFYELFLMAHERDITFNQLAREALTVAMERAERDGTLGELAKEALSDVDKRDE